MDGHYYGPWSFDVTDDGDACVDDPNSPDFNAPMWAKRLTDEANGRLSNHLHNDAFI